MAWANHCIISITPVRLIISTRPDKFALGARHITISNQRNLPGIRKLADLRRPWDWAISLHATSDQQRAKSSASLPLSHRGNYQRLSVFTADESHPTIEYALLKILMIRR